MAGNRSCNPSCSRPTARCARSANSRSGCTSTSAAATSPASCTCTPARRPAGTGIMMHLGDGDRIASTHRGHGHCIAKGVDVGDDDEGDLRQEGRGSATARAARCTSPTSSKGMMGANGIGGGRRAAGLRCGAGRQVPRQDRRRRDQLRRRRRQRTRAPSFESLNLAAVWNPPAIFVVENNGYAESTSRDCPWRWTVADRAAGFGLPGVTVDGTDFFAVHEAAARIIAARRQGGGPTLLECKMVPLLRPLRGRRADLPRRPASEDIRANQDCLKKFAAAVTEAGVVAPAELTHRPRGAGPDREAVAEAKARRCRPRPTCHRRLRPSDRGEPSTWHARSA